VLPDSLVAGLHTFLRIKLVRNADFRFLFRVGRLGTLKFEELRVLAQCLIVYSLWMSCESLKTALCYLHNTAFWGRQ